MNKDIIINTINNLTFSHFLAAPEHYDVLTQEDILKCIQLFMLPQSEFSRIQEDLVKVLSLPC